MNSHIALVEDDDVIRQNYVDLLEREGYSVDAYADRSSAEAAFDAALPSLALLDIALDGERDGGFQLCLQLRRKSPILPIIFLTSHDSEPDKISGLRLGADDYLSKKTSFDLLLVRIETLLRRARELSQFETGLHSGAASATDHTLPEIDTTLSRVSWKGQNVDLSLTQFWIAEALLKEPGEVRTFSELMIAAKIWVEPNTIAAHIKNIRRAFREVDPDFSAIQSARGVGYRWLPE